MCKQTVQYPEQLLPKAPFEILMLPEI
jgi:hypothetical protein